MPNPDSEAFADDADAVANDDFKPLSAQEAQQWRERNPPWSPWRVVAGQAGVGIVVAGLVWLVSGRTSWAVSLAYGVMAVVLPAALMARALARRNSVAGAALAMFFVWELVKVALTVVLLLAAPRLVPGLNWLALLAGLVVTVKVYGVALWWQTRQRSRPVLNLN
jgi:ATP synthase protein I